MSTKKPFILLEGTPFEKKVYLENPANPTKDDLGLIQRLYGLPQGLDLPSTVSALNKLVESGQSEIATPSTMESPEAFALDQAEKIAAVENRIKLNEDPLKYMYNNMKQKLDISVPRVLSQALIVGAVIPDEIKIGSYLPKDMVSIKVF